jgi:hypothetical protein
MQDICWICNYTWLTFLGTDYVILKFEEAILGITGFNYTPQVMMVNPCEAYEQEEKPFSSG